MEWFISYIKIALILFAWIIACVGLGNVVFLLILRFVKLEKFAESSAESTPDSAIAIFCENFALKIFTQLLLGAMIFTFIASLLHLFIPINSIISIVFLALGIIAFIAKINDFQLLDFKVLLSGSLAFFIVAILSFFHDSMGDSVNYHIQIVTWIQQSPLIFGLGNIHGRLGFNGIIYNFYALSDVAQIFPALRAFIANEIIYFGFIFSAIYSLVEKSFAKFHLLFIVCSAIPFSFILKWGEFRGLYCEGIGAVFGIFIFSGLIYVLTHKFKSNNLLTLLFIISVFATMIKIANVALVLAVIIVFIYLNHDFYKKQFYKSYVFLGIFCFIFCLTWTLKGIATSGMIAYPASVGFFSSLPFAVSEAQRESEVCWIMSWARAPGQNCKEVLESSAWMLDWFSMKTRYFEYYFKHFVYSFFALFILFVCLCVYKKWRKEALFDFSAFCVAILSIAVGIIFWFVSGPDPRFGMVYIFPLIAIVMAYNLIMINSAESTPIKSFFAIAFILALLPFWKLMRDMYMILILFCLLFPSAILGMKVRKYYYVLVIVLAFISVPNMYRSQLGEIKQLPKVLPIFAQKQISDFGVEIYHRIDNQKEGYDTYNYEPMPMTPYSTKDIKEERFLGRKAYINARKDDK